MFAAMAGEDGAGRVILFGGLSGTSAMDDTWAWSAGAWEQLFPATSPPPSYGGHQGGYRGSPGHSRRQRSFLEDLFD